MDDEWQLTPIGKYAAHDPTTSAAAVHQQAASTTRNARHLSRDKNEEMILNRSRHIRKRKEENKNKITVLKAMDE